MRPRPSSPTCTREHRGPRSTRSGALLRRIVSDNLPRLVEAADVQGRTVPGFVRGELEAFVRCGDFNEGFAELHCTSCDHHRLVPFSCQSRGFSSWADGQRQATALRLSAANQS